MNCAGQKHTKPPHTTREGGEEGGMCSSDVNVLKDIKKLKDEKKAGKVITWTTDKTGMNVHCRLR